MMMVMMVVLLRSLHAVAVVMVQAGVQKLEERAPAVLVVMVMVEVM